MIMIFLLPQQKKDELDYSICPLTKDPLQRADWCGERYGSIDDVRKKCENKFCHFCCGDKIPFVLKSENAICIKECEAEEIP